MSTSSCLIEGPTTRPQGTSTVRLTNLKNFLRHWKDILSELDIKQRISDEIRRIFFFCWRLGLSLRITTWHHIVVTWPILPRISSYYHVLWSNLSLEMTSCYFQSSTSLDVCCARKRLAGERACHPSWAQLEYGATDESLESSGFTVKVCDT